MLRRAAVLFIVVFALGVSCVVLIVNSLRVVQRVTFITHVRGSVEVKEPGESDFHPLAGEAHVLAGSIVRTGKEASALLHWVDGTRLQAGADTTLKVLECRFDKRTDAGRSLFQLDVGRIWVRVLRSLSADSKFEIRTPTATAGVRGTTFSVEVQADGSTKILVYEGDVHVQSGEKAYGVQEGQALAIQGEGDAAARELTEEERADGEQASVAKPLLVVTDPDDGQSAPAGQPLTVRGRGEAGADLSINGEPAPIGPDGTFSFDYVPDKPGTETIEIIETDARGTEASEKVTIKVE
jgi:hypothetical protein